jgi:hypothetical protein
MLFLSDFSNCIYQLLTMKMNMRFRNHRCQSRSLSHAPTIMLCHSCVPIPFFNRNRVISCAWFAAFTPSRELYFHVDIPCCVQFVLVSGLEVQRKNQTISIPFFFLTIIEKLDRCPICRSPITAFFRIRSEEYVNASNTVLEQEPKQKISVTWIDALNDRLTDFLGFR